MLSPKARLELLAKASRQLGVSHCELTERQREMTAQFGPKVTRD